MGADNAFPYTVPRARAGSDPPQIKSRGRAYELADRALSSARRALRPYLKATTSIAAVSSDAIRSHLLNEYHSPPSGLHAELPDNSKRPIVRIRRQVGRMARTVSRSPEQRPLYNAWEK